ncbi:MAG: alpha/beta hydrolase [Bacteroidales bacterium]|nr:alpha/beta hydrolase [Bacteroidales bacterium]
MKALKFFLLMFAGLLLPLACEQPDELLTDELSEENLKCTGQPELGQDRYLMMRGTGLKVHYKVIGRGPVNIVFIPGWTNPLTVYSKQFDYFKHKARSIYIDLPGHGLSSAPENIEYTMDLMADAIFEVIRREGIMRFVGVGFSWGDSPLTQFERKHPGMIRQLILLDVSIGAWPPITEEAHEATYNYFLNLSDETKAGLLQQLIPPATAPGDLVDWGKYFLEFPNKLLANMYYYDDAEEYCQPYPWSIPILLIYNHLKPAKELKTKRFFPGCEIDTLGGDQHVIQWAYHETVNELMDDFINYEPWRPGPGRTTMPFVAHFTGNYVSIGPCETCGDSPPYFLVVNEGNGFCNCIGNITHHFEFCSNAAKGFYPQGYIKAYFTASNGDRLDVVISGRVIKGRSYGHPFFVTSYWRDPFTITGGTGRFEGARGSGFSNDYNSSKDPLSHHQWRGTITLVRR